MWDLNLYFLKAWKSVHEWIKPFKFNRWSKISSWENKKIFHPFGFLSQMSYLAYVDYYFMDLFLKCFDILFAFKNFSTYFTLKWLNKTKGESSSFSLVFSSLKLSYSLKTGYRYNEATKFAFNLIYTVQ